MVTKSFWKCRQQQTKEKTRLFERLIEMIEGETDFGENKDGTFPALLGANEPQKLILLLIFLQREINFIHNRNENA